MEGYSIREFQNTLFGNVRGMLINGEPWFIGMDVAMALGYKDTDQALRKNVNDSDKLTRPVDGSGQSRNMIFINESGLYSLVFSSRMPNAKVFTHWVTSEVLPTMRRIGFDNAMRLLNEENARLNMQNNQLQQDLNNEKAHTEWLNNYILGNMIG